MRTDALVTRDLFRRQPPGDQPEDLDLPAGQLEIGVRVVHQNTTRQRPTDKRAERQPCGQRDETNRRNAARPHRQRQPKAKVAQHPTQAGLRHALLADMHGMHIERHRCGSDR